MDEIKKLVVIRMKGLFWSGLVGMIIGLVICWAGRDYMLSTISFALVTVVTMHLASSGIEIRDERKFNPNILVGDSVFVGICSFIWVIVMTWFIYSLNLPIEREIDCRLVIVYGIFSGIAIFLLELGNI